MERLEHRHSSVATASRKNAAVSFGDSPMVHVAATNRALYVQDPFQRPGRVGTRAFWSATGWAHGTCCVHLQSRVVCCGESLCTTPSQGDVLCESCCTASSHGNVPPWACLAVREAASWRMDVQGGVPDEGTIAKAEPEIAKGRIDFMLPPDSSSSMIQAVRSVRAHTGYWESSSVALFLSRVCHGLDPLSGGA